MLLRGNSGPPLLFSTILVSLAFIFVLQHAAVGWSPLMVSSFTAELVFGKPARRLATGDESAPPPAAHLVGKPAAASAAAAATVSTPVLRAPAVASKASAAKPAAAPAGGKRLVERPSTSSLDASRADLDTMCGERDAWKADFWFSNRTTSVNRQSRVRDALNNIAQAAVADMSQPSKETARPCKRLVVSLSTIPSRIDRLEGLMRAIKSQSLPPDAILIGIPPFAPRMKQRYVVPEYLAMDPAVKIVHLPIDFGPLSKVAAALYAETDPDTCIITVDDDNLPKDHLFRLSATWSAVFPGAVIAESGWNTTCILSKIPYVCGEGYDVYVFVRQDWDVMCHPDSLPRYNFHQCLGPVDKRFVRPADVVMGVSNPLYRRGMFDDDFLDVSKVVAKRKVLQMLKKDEAARAKLGPAGAKAASSSGGGGGNEKGSDKEKDKDDPKKDLVDDDLRKLAVEVLKHPDLQMDDATVKRYARVPPPEQLFLVDDVYISAYMARKNVPRLIVPAASDAVFPIPMVEARNPTWAGDAPPPAPKRQYDTDIAAVDALHGQARFDLANYGAVKYLHQLGWW